MADPTTGAAAPTTPVDDLRAAIDNVAALTQISPRAVGRNLQANLVSAAASLLDALVPARDRLRTAISAVGPDSVVRRDPVFAAAEHLLAELGDRTTNLQQPSSVPSPDRVPGVGEARDNLQAAIVHFNGRGGTRDGASRAVTMRDAALDLLHALRIKFGAELDAQQEERGEVSPALNDLAIAVVAYEEIAGRHPEGQALLDAAKLVLSEPALALPPALDTLTGLEALALADLVEQLRRWKPQRQPSAVGDLPNPDFRPARRRRRSRNSSPEFSTEGEEAPEGGQADHVLPV